MSSFKIRPRFKHAFSGEHEDLEQKIVENLKSQDQLTFTHLPGHLYIKIHKRAEHFWSPQLNLTFKEEEGQLIVRGLYGPNPTVWGIFFFGYVILGILTLFLGMWGLSQYSLGLDHTILWSIPVFGVIAIILYVSAQAGQKMGAQQMFDIHHFYEEQAGGRIEVD